MNFILFLHIVYVILFIILLLVIGAFLLGLLIFFHESGHFLAAKFFGVRVEEFGFGFPPRIWGKKRGETIYSINAIPAGGFVRLLGEEGGVTDKRSFSSKGPWLQSAILVSGVVMNILVAFVLFTVVLSFNHFKFEAPTIIPTTGESLNFSFPFGKQTKPVFITAVDSGSPADKASITPPNEVISINGKAINSIDGLQKIVDLNKGKKVTLVVRNINSNQTRTVFVVPRVNPPKEQGPLGIGLDQYYVVAYSSLADKIFVGPLHSVNMVYEQWIAIGGLISKSIGSRSVAPVTKEVSGPVGIVGQLGSYIGQAGASAVWTIVMLIGLISLMLGLVNVLPIPAADGGRLVFTLLEGVFRIKVSENIQRWVNTIGFYLLILLIILVTFNDISKYPSYFRSFFK
jgi:regulator of sigma E protease